MGWLRIKLSIHPSRADISHWAKKEHKKADLARVHQTGAPPFAAQIQRALARDGGRVRRSSFFHRYSALSIYGRSNGPNCRLARHESGVRLGPKSTDRHLLYRARAARKGSSTRSPMLMLSGISCVTISVVTPLPLQNAVYIVGDVQARLIVQAPKTPRPAAGCPALWPVCG